VRSGNGEARRRGELRARRHERERAWLLPVVEGAAFVGLLSKSTPFDRHRKELLVQLGESRYAWSRRGAVPRGQCQLTSTE